MSHTAQKTGTQLVNFATQASGEGILERLKTLAASKLERCIRRKVASSCAREPKGVAYGSVAAAFHGCARVHSMAVRDYEVSRITIITTLYSVKSCDRSWLLGEDACLAGQGSSHQ